MTGLSGSVLSPLPSVSRLPSPCRNLSPPQLRPLFRFTLVATAFIAAAMAA